MSDKFFFKGRQDARQSHISYGYEANVNQKAGSKKYPLTLVVTSEVRQQEIEAQVTEAGLYANITVDTSDGAVESLAELEMQLNKVVTSVTQQKLPARNEPCLCGSGKKYKKCCG
ncbi:PBPRA1643 family SWIM/SEC-C metal-binding motif protein [Ferrimonas lipolytica]|uniref:Zinc chelation protein SecC n=1 Tax=Ferrimonas lipolytica TaxID=2724191 RepID=A0A6H1UFS4_9GAMM|nr:PBPRA1643 family SWIM/SEC-C metal-binding motif protein [Ferrimonas lipolytica]QIZ77066.1 zinc chelation protein SecC [Ferrimonas lipolytica]